MFRLVITSKYVYVDLLVIYTALYGVFTRKLKYFNQKKQQINITRPKYIFSKMDPNNSLENRISHDWIDIDDSMPSNNINNQMMSSAFLFVSNLPDAETPIIIEETKDVEAPNETESRDIEPIATSHHNISLPPLNLEKSSNWINDSILYFNEKKDPEFTGPTQVSNWIIPQIFLCGGYINSDSEVTQLKNAGITRFVCLNAEYGTSSFNYYEYAHRLLAESFIHIPVKDMNITDDNIIRQKSSEIAHMILSGERVYIHCSGGHGRTGTFVALVLNILYPDLTVQDMFDYIQYSHDQRYYNKFGNLLWTKHLKNENHDNLCVKDNVFADNFVPGQVPTPQTLAQRRQVLRLWKYPETECIINVPYRR